MFSFRMRVLLCTNDLGAKMLIAIVALLLANSPIVAEETGSPLAPVETDSRYVMSDDSQAARNSDPLGKV